jgi:hypothetical protein
MVSNERLERFFILFNDAYLTKPARPIPPRLCPQGGSEYAVQMAVDGFSMLNLREMALFSAR